jgi:ribonuclease VapC
VIAVDTSALVAVVLGEPELERFSAILSRGPAAVSAAAVTETAMVLHARQGADAVQDLHVLLARAAIEVHAVDADTAWAAHAAWVRFGKGRHPAGLNFGDCFSYALAKALAVPLLYKGDDFSQTDLTPAT